MKCMKLQQGFTMIELLITLLCVSLLSVLCTSLIALIMPLNQPSYEAEDDIGLKQLRLILAQANNIQVTPQVLYFEYHGDTYRIEQYQDRLVKRKGFEVLLQNIDAIDFEQSYDCVVMRYERDGKTKEETIACGN